MAEDIWVECSFLFIMRYWINCMVQLIEWSIMVHMIRGEKGWRYFRWKLTRRIWTFEPLSTLSFTGLNVTTNSSAEYPLLLVLIVSICNKLFRIEYREVLEQRKLNRWLDKNGQSTHTQFIGMTSNQILDFTKKGVTSKKRRRNTVTMLHIWTKKNVCKTERPIE